MSPGWRLIRLVNKLIDGMDEKFSYLLGLRKREKSAAVMFSAWYFSTRILTSCTHPELVVFSGINMANSFHVSLSEGGELDGPRLG